MRKIGILMIAAIIFGCAGEEEYVKTFTARQITEDNIFSYGPVEVKVNPDLDYLNISGRVKKDKKYDPNDPTIREFHLFAHPGVNKVVLIETHTRKHPNAFQRFQNDFTKNMAVIQKGRKLIDGKHWDVYVRALPEFPQHIIDAASQKGIGFENYRCGLEIGCVRLIDRFSRINVSYIKGAEDCMKLPQNGGILSEEQIQSIRSFANQFDESISISDQSSR